MNELHLSNPHFHNLLLATTRLSDRGQYMVNIDIPIIDYHPYRKSTVRGYAILEIFTNDDIFNNCMNWWTNNGDYFLLSSFECFNKILRPIKRQIHREEIFGYECTKK
jgi:hypothetical protein